MVYGLSVVHLCVGSRIGVGADDEHTCFSVVGASADGNGAESGSPMDDCVAVLVAGNLFCVRTDVAFRSPHCPMDGLVYLRFNADLRRPIVENGVLDDGCGFERLKLLTRRVSEARASLTRRVSIGFTGAKRNTEDLFALNSVVPCALCT